MAEDRRQATLEDAQTYIKESGFNLPSDPSNRKANVLMRAERVDALISIEQNLEARGLKAEGLFSEITSEERQRYDQAGSLTLFYRGRTTDRKLAEKEVRRQQAAKESGQVVSVSEPRELSRKDLTEEQRQQLAQADIAVSKGELTKPAYRSIVEQIVNKDVYEQRRVDIAERNRIQGNIQRRIEQGQKAEDIFAEIPKEYRTVENIRSVAVAAKGIEEYNKQQAEQREFFTFQAKGQGEYLKQGGVERATRQQEDKLISFSSQRGLVSEYVAPDYKTPFQRVYDKKFGEGSLVESAKQRIERRIESVSSQSSKYNEFAQQEKRLGKFSPTSEGRKAQVLAGITNIGVGVASASMVVLRPIQTTKGVFSFIKDVGLSIKETKFVGSVQDLGYRLKTNPARTATELYVGGKIVNIGLKAVPKIRTLKIPQTKKTTFYTKTGSQYLGLDKKNKVRIESEGGQIDIIGYEFGPTKTLTLGTITQTKSSFGKVDITKELKDIPLTKESAKIEGANPDEAATNIYVGSPLETETISKSLKVIAKDLPQGKQKTRVSQSIEFFQREILNPTKNLPSPKIGTPATLPKETKYLGPKGTELVYKISRTRLLDNDEISFGGDIFGSTVRVAKTQTVLQLPSGKQARFTKVPGDIETQFLGQSTSLIETKAKDTVAGLQKLGYEARLGKKKKLKKEPVYVGRNIIGYRDIPDEGGISFEIEARGGEKNLPEFTKVAEFKGAESDLNVPEFVAGFEKIGKREKTLNPFTNLGQRTTSQAEEIRGVSQGVLRIIRTESGVDVFPEPKRQKDIGSLYPTLLSFSQNKPTTGGPIRFLKESVRKERLDQAAIELERFYSKKQLTQQLDTGEVEIKFSPSRTSTPSLSSRTAKLTSSSISSFGRSKIQSRSLSLIRSKSLSSSLSKSLSKSKSTSLSPSSSISPSQSRSRSTSTSLSPSLSKSLSPSRSISRSLSVSPSLSPSLSKSLSPSMSISPSISISPNVGEPPFYPTSIIRTSTKIGKKKKKKQSSALTRGFVGVPTLSAITTGQGVKLTAKQIGGGFISPFQTRRI